MVNLDLASGRSTTSATSSSRSGWPRSRTTSTAALDELMYKQAFRTHPYRWPVIGWMKDIKAVTPGEGGGVLPALLPPDNAVVVIAGRFDEAATLDADRRAPTARIPASTEAPRATRRSRSTRRPPRCARRSGGRCPPIGWSIGFPAPAPGDADRAAYEMLNEILRGRAVVAHLPARWWSRTRVASSVHGDVAPTRDPGPVRDLGPADQGPHRRRGRGASSSEAIAELGGAPPSARPSCGKAKARIETEFWRELTSSHGRAEMLGEFEIATRRLPAAASRAATSTRA